MSVKDVLDFVGEHLVFIFVFCLCFSGGVAQFLGRVLDQRHQRKLAAARHVQRLQILAERRRIAEVEGDAIKLLIADDALGQDFSRRLRVALDVQAKASPPVERDAEIDGELEAVAEEVACGDGVGRGRCSGGSGSGS